MKIAVMASLLTKWNVYIKTHVLLKIRNCLGIPISRQKIDIFVYVEALFFDV